MNCETFEPAVNDLARGQMMEATLRESALAHAEDCEHCSARLATERALSFSLRALAANDETTGAPARVETLLRAAFRQHQTAPLAPTVAASTARRWRWAQWAAAAAAVVLSVLAIQAFRLGQQPPPSQRVFDRVAASPASEGNPGTIAALPAPAPEQIDGRDALPVINSPRPVNRQAVAVNYTPTSRRPVRRQRSAQADGAAQAEIVTDFMPLTYGAELSPNEGGQLVRVELPRSALASLGLPMNVERTDERVKADVLLGHDGLARAIRFVR